MGSAGKKSRKDTSQNSILQVWNIRINRKKCLVLQVSVFPPFTGRTTALQNQELTCLSPPGNIPESRALHLLLSFWGCEPPTPHICTGFALMQTQLERQHSQLTLDRCKWLPKYCQIPKCWQVIQHLRMKEFLYTAVGLNFHTQTHMCTHNKNDLGAEVVHAQVTGIQAQYFQLSFSEF